MPPVAASSSNQNIAFSSSKRIAPVALSTNALWAKNDALKVTIGTSILNVIAVRTGGVYDLGAGEFVWNSADGLVSATNGSGFTGGGLVASGSGPGTVVGININVDPNLATIHIATEDV